MGRYEKVLSDFWLRKVPGTYGVLLEFATKNSWTSTRENTVVVIVGTKSQTGWKAIEVIEIQSFIHYCFLIFVPYLCFSSNCCSFLLIQFLFTLPSTSNYYLCLYFSIPFCFVPSLTRYTFQSKIYPYVSEAHCGEFLFKNKLLQ